MTMKWCIIELDMVLHRLLGLVLLSTGLGRVQVCASVVNVFEPQAMVVEKDTLPGTGITDSVLTDRDIRQRARALGMVDTAEVNPKLRRLEYLERDLLPAIDTAALFRSNPKYIRHRTRATKGWLRLIPKQFTVQYAGSIGVASIGVGWIYGRGQHWETDMLVGVVPQYHSEGWHTTFTLKQRYVPWHCRLSSHWTLQPLTAGVFFNTISGDDFWKHLPERYPKHYYGFSTKIRSNVFLGQRLRYRIPSRNRRFHSAVSAYYEISSCDLYIVSKAVNKDYPWTSTLSLAFGLRWEF